MHYGMLTDSNTYDTSLVDITRVSVIVKSLIGGMISHSDKHNLQFSL